MDNETKWNKVGTGTYETSNRRFQAKRRENGAWMLLQRDGGDWEWCQSFNLLRDAKYAASQITENKLNPDK